MYRFRRTYYTRLFADKAYLVSLGRVLHSTPIYFTISLKKRTIYP